MTVLSDLEPPGKPVAFRREAIDLVTWKDFNKLQRKLDNNKGLKNAHQIPVFDCYLFEVELSTSNFMASLAYQHSL